ncbi:MAG: TDG/mug DNA glycosylase family protein [Cycloclasticus sp.]|jgi:TDG/mug DNA glycosylase family protein
MNTLPDLLDDHLTVLSVGLNPSIPSAKAGFYFANPRNRFWPALNACGMFSETLEPSLASCQHLQRQYHIGFTDLVKRPTAGCKDLNAADYRAGSARLLGLIAELKPTVIWFNGKLTCQKYLQYSPQKGSVIEWGLQPWRLLNSSVFVTPNPSPANAAFSLPLISDSYRALFQHALGSAKC